MKNLLKVPSLLVIFFALTFPVNAETSPYPNYNTDAVNNYENYDYNSFDSNYQDSSYGYTENWEIKNYHADITIAADGKIEITENILADFTNEAHKGLARTIPYAYSGDKGTEVDMEFVSANNENGISWDNEVSRENGYLNINMYEPNRSLMNSEATFILKYTAYRVFGFFDEKRATEEKTFSHDEFYWNVNGTEWVVPAKAVSATIHLPKAIPEGELKTICYTGSYESTIQNCEATVIDNKTIEFKTTQPLNAYENLTVVVAIPYGTIPQPAPPSILEIIWKLFIRNLGVAFAFGTLLVMFLLWYNYGRDDQSVSDTVMPHYTPPTDMSPAETGTIIDESLDPKDITSTILDFAVRGFIKINEVEEKGLLFKSTDYELELLKEYITTKDFEKTIMSAIFPINKAGEKIRISTLTNKFYAYLPAIEKSIMKQLVDNDYFPNSPSTTKAIYRGIGGAIMAGAIFGSEILTMMGISMASIIGIGAAGLIIILFGNIMPRKTKKGTETYYKLKGLYEYINTAEKDRMHFQEKNNIMFEKLLPYAMAFGLISKWTKAFDGLIKTPPNWYHTNRAWGSNGFTMIYFADRLGAISGKFNQNITSRPGKGGSGGAWGGGSGFSGGFSGGGFGGGGGRGL